MGRIRQNMVGAFAVIMLTTLVLTGQSITAGAAVSRIQVQTYSYSAISFYVGTSTTAGSVQTAFVTVNPCTGDFSGTRTFIIPDWTTLTAITGNSSGGSATFTISYSAPGQTSGYQVSATVAFNPDGSFAGTWSDNYYQGPQAGTVTSDTPVISNASSWKNHGQYVAANGGGDDNAHSCLGMPMAGRR